MRATGWASKAVLAVGIAVVAVGVVGCDGASVTGPSEVPEAFQQEPELGQVEANKGIIVTGPRPIRPSPKPTVADDENAGGVQADGIETSPFKPPRIPPKPPGKGVVIQ